MSLVKFSNSQPNLFDYFFNQEALNGLNKNYSRTNTTIPLVNVSENTDGFSIEMAVPGFKKEDFKIELDNGILTILSEKEIKNQDENADNYTIKEYSYQSFKRSFTLSDSIEQEKINASYTDGILKVFVPKKEEAKPKPVKVIEVS
ncbi:Hsp20/alpha crystallin family protein [Wenyingzhuangia aestuarii]|uniref:Hsp20/alpha crystallin family protein n=1 Tax=Wenyingzhuangia aestuarii TaxID=1647582 RepID=UPI001438F1FD|nr:Hsp20/alpha crystallin family protein [Wenyingzhuangia aestuarii]NJB82210.1 HSP20 family protein [Wenyingzhuangia aestuarii]